MDYNQFYVEVAAWIQQANQMGVHYGLASSQFWEWVADSSGELTIKYNNNPLVVKQMVMLVEWMESFLDKQKG
jgi:hypothetical protein